MTPEEKRKEYQRQWHLKHKERRLAAAKERRNKICDWYRDYKSKLSCERCGFSHPAALDFHHKDSEQKESEVNQLLRNKMTVERILAEIAKCEVLCANCHRILHYGGVAQFG